jgi:hypothetical protein
MAVTHRGWLAGDGEFNGAAEAAAVVSLVVIHSAFPFNKSAAMERSMKSKPTVISSTARNLLRQTPNHQPLTSADFSLQSK